ncbi:MAG: hypothetical protein ACLTAI_13900 [Thomasclavelia sp.]
MKDIKVIIGILVGNTIYALAVAMFILPNDLITGNNWYSTISKYNIEYSCYIICFYL